MSFEALVGAARQELNERVLPHACDSRGKLDAADIYLKGVLAWAETQDAASRQAYRVACKLVFQDCKIFYDQFSQRAAIIEARKELPKPPSK